MTLKANARLLDIVLFVILLFSIAALFMAHENPFARKVVCAHIKLCPTIPNAKAWEKIVYDLAVGSLISLIFYALVVRLPDYQRRQRLKKSLERHYHEFRTDCIQTMLMVADGTYAADLPDKLLEQDRFRDYFKQKVAPDRDRWDEFSNNLTEQSLQEIQTHMEIFKDELSFIINNTDISNGEVFEFIKRLSAVIRMMKDVTLGYDDTKQLARFLWDIFAGFSLITGYRSEDIVRKMISGI